MARIHIFHLEAREEATNSRKHVIRDVMTSGAPYEQCSAVISRFLGVFIRKVAQMVKTCGEYFDWDSKLHVIAGL